MSLNIVVLAAGKGTRMHSERAKVLHELAGRPLLAHVLATAQQLQPVSLTVVYGHDGARLKQTFQAESAIHWAKQSQQLGTGHAVKQALPYLQTGDLTLVLYGDVPLIRAETLAALIMQASADSISVLTAVVPDPTGYGRIQRDDDGTIIAIVEQGDATTEQLAIQEINTGIMVVPTAKLAAWLNALQNTNAQQEYYLTDVIALAVKSGVLVKAVLAENVTETLGVNTPQQLSQLERYYQQQRAIALMQQGVTLRDPARFDLRGELIVGHDVVIDIGVVLQGQVRIGNHVTIEPYCVIANSEIADYSHIAAHSVIDNSHIGAHCQVGPFARLRPGTVLAEKAKVGNFVEVKNSEIGKGSKVNHLSYIGDSQLGQQVNIGAGTITCNYDGANKYKTVIEDEAFIGSDTQLIAPVTVGKGATIGAGSTITKTVPPGGLALARQRQQYYPDWQRPEKKSKPE